MSCWLPIFVSVSQVEPSLTGYFSRQTGGGDLDPLVLILEDPAGFDADVLGGPDLAIDQLFHHRHRLSIDVLGLGDLVQDRGLLPTAVDLVVPLGADLEGVVVRRLITRLGLLGGFFARPGKAARSMKKVQATDFIGILPRGAASGRVPEKPTNPGRADPGQAGPHLGLAPAGSLAL